MNELAYNLDCCCREWPSDAWRCSERTIVISFEWEGSLRPHLLQTDVVDAVWPAVALVQGQSTLGGALQYILLFKISANSPRPIM